MKKLLVLGVVVGLGAVVSPAARAEVFPTVTLRNTANPAQPFDQGLLYIQREQIAPAKWLWTYDLNNLKDTGAVKAPIRRFFLGIDPSQAGLDWQSRIWPLMSQYSANEAPDPFAAAANLNFIKAAVLNSDDIEWNWDNGSAANTSDDFLGGTMRFQFETDLPLTTFAVHEARGSKGPGAGIGVSPAAVPEPASLALLLGGAAPLLRRRRR